MAISYPSEPHQMISLEKVRWRLAIVWFPLGGLIFLILITQTIGGIFGEDMQRVWAWALPNFLPTLAFMVSVFAADALRPYAQDTFHVRKNFFILAMGLSIFYLFIILAAILVQPFLQFMNPDMIGGTARKIKLLESTNIFLGPLQGLVIGSLTVLFFLKEGEGLKLPPTLTSTASHTTGEQE